MSNSKMEKELKTNRFFVLVIVLVALEAILFSAGNFKLNETVRLEKEASERVVIALQNISIEARAVSVYDINKSKKIYGKNDEVAMPIASLAKIMTVTLGLNRHRKDDIIYISPNAVGQAGDFGIFANEKWKVNDLAKFTLIVSANDGAYALAEKDESFLDRLNSKAKKIGMKNTLFLNSTGLDLLTDTGLPIQAGAFASAEDANLMAIYGLRAYPEIFSVTAEPEINLTSLSGFLHSFKNTDTITEKIPNLVFSKTGYTEIAGGNLTVIFKDKRGHYIAVTVLGSSFDGRFSDMEKIVNVLYNN